MEPTKVILSGLWLALMLTYLLGDVLRIYSGDMTPGEIEGVKATQVMWFGAAVFMLVPIVMLYLSLTLAYPANRWVNMVLAAIMFTLNLFGLPSYSSLYDQFLIVVGLGINLLMIWHAWQWTAA